MNISGPVALVTAAAARHLDEDLAPLQSALSAAGADVQIIDWDSQAADWSQFRIAVLRSTWDYTARINEFLAWADRISMLTRLVNSADIVRWNTDKHYLSFLTGSGVPTVPSVFIEPGQSVEKAVTAFLDSHPAAELVVKPVIGGGPVTRSAILAPESEIAAHAARLLDAKRSVILQPYLRRIDDIGKTAMMFINGEFSHAIRKAPLLKLNGESTRALFAPEKISSRTPSADELRVAAQALAAIPFDRVMYARVDLIRDDGGAPCILEVELTEPSLFFAYAPGSPQKLARTILSWE